VSTGDWVEFRDIKSEIDKDMRPGVEALVAKGWRLRRQGHKFRAYCPCGHPEGQTRIDGSPKDMQRHRDRLERAAELCPDRHGLIR